MKRSVAMMACVLSGALMISAYSPVVFAETTEKTEASKTDEAKDESEKKEDTSKVASLLQVNQTIKEENEVLNKQLKDKLAELDMKEVEYNKRISELSRKEINLEAAIQSTEDTRAQLEDKLAAIRSLGV